MGSTPTRAAAGAPRGRRPHHRLRPRSDERKGCMNVLETFAVPGRVAVVTGGNRGLGRAFAHALGEAGAKVAIVARDDAASARVVDELTAAGVRVGAFRADVGDRASVVTVAQQIAGELGPVDVLV